MNVPIKCNLKHAEWGGQTAMCLQARDYKGFGTGTQLQNGVLVYAGNIPNDTRGGHGSMDKHRWDTVVVKVIRDDEIISV